MNSLVCDTGPLNYLIQIECTRVLPELFQSILIPDAVHAELLASAAPSEVRSWAKTLPEWCRLCPAVARSGQGFSGLSEADAEVLLLAEANAAAVLLDDLAARKAARRRQLPVIGTLGLLEFAALDHLADLPEVIRRLRRTNARISDELFHEILRRNGFST